MDDIDNTTPDPANLTQQTSSVEQRWSAMCQTYAAQLPDKIAKIEEECRALLQGEKKKEDFKALHRSAHVLSGSGGTFGFTALSEAARAMEYFLTSIMEDTNGDTSPPSAEEGFQLNSHLVALKRAAHQPDPKVPVAKLEALALDESAKPYRILIIEDEPILASHYALILQQAGMVTSVSTDPLQIMESLVEFAPDLILMDIYMASCNGLELAALIRQQEAYICVPIVFLSAETNRDTQLAALRLGADDFLTKPIQPDHLISAVLARAQRTRHLCAHMGYDSLTGLLNHSKIIDRISVEVARAARHKQQLAFAILDINGFKSVNDNFGYSAGDGVLKGLTRLLQQRLRKTDSIGRYGGEEFAIVLYETDGAMAVKILDKICASFAELRYHAGSKEFSLTISCGVATFPQLQEVSSLVEAATQALNQAKQDASQCVILADGIENAAPQE